MSNYGSSIQCEECGSINTTVRILVDVDTKDQPVRRLFFCKSCYTPATVVRHLPSRPWHELVPTHTVVRPGPLTKAKLDQWICDCGYMNNTEICTKCSKLRSEQDGAES